MIKLQIIPQSDLDAYKLLRAKVTHEARTWSWSNKAKTRLRHSRTDTGYIEVGSAEGILVAEIHPSGDDAYFLTEKFIGRLVAWFPDDIAAINLQFVAAAQPKKVKARKKR
jgi:hypothetical protein